MRAAHSIALAGTGSFADASDVVQQAFLVAVEHLLDCREPERFSGWLLQIVRRCAVDSRRGRSRRERLNDELVLSDAHGHPQHELRRALLKALNALPERQREVVLLHDLEGYKHDEISELLGISAVLSRQELFAAKKALRPSLEADARAEQQPLAEERSRANAVR